MTNTAIGEVILDQLGGRRFSVMTGAREFSAYSVEQGDVRGGLRFRIGKNPQGVSIVVIRLTVADLYDVTFYGGRMADRIVAEVSGVYADQLLSVIEQQTGLLCSLGTLGTMQRAAAEWNGATGPVEVAS